MSSEASAQSGCNQTNHLRAEPFSALQTETERREEDFGSNTLQVSVSFITKLLSIGKGFTTREKKVFCWGDELTSTQTAADINLISHSRAELIWLSSISVFHTQSTPYLPKKTKTNLDLYFFNRFFPFNLSPAWIGFHRAVWTLFSFDPLMFESFEGNTLWLAAAPCGTEASGHAPIRRADSFWAYWLTAGEDYTGNVNVHSFVEACVIIQCTPMNVSWGMEGWDVYEQIQYI